jgi:DNA-binding NarL/FixJ family response regulator
MTMTDATKREILARYRSHAARFERYAARRNRPGSGQATPPSREPALVPAMPKVRLSRREQEILELIASGFTDAEIASQIVLSEFTVKTHVKRLLTKLGARNRAHAVALAAHRGLLRLAA